MNKKEQTTNTYNTRANELAKKFDSLGARVSDIDEALSLIKKSNPKVLEIGCGNGRDALEILKRTDDYVGIDISSKLIELAKEKNPAGTFIVADIEDYSFPTELDAIFAFASLIHVPKESLQNVFHRALVALKQGGVFRISMKYADMYKETIKEDAFGTRTFYLYSKGDIAELAHAFTIVKSDLNDRQGQMFLEILLRKD